MSQSEGAGFWSMTSVTGVKLGEADVWAQAGIAVAPITSVAAPTNRVNVRSMSIFQDF